MKYLRVGIAYEGGDDGKLIAAIVRKVLEPYDFTFDEFDPETPGTAIVDFVPSYTKRFVEAEVDLGIYCTDQDKSQVSRRTLIKKKIQKTDEAFLLKSAIGVPVPHIEAWLLQQDSIVKNLLGLHPEDSLPHGHLPPKDRLTALYSESETYQRSKNDLRIEIAQSLDIELCCRQSTDFKQFVQDIRSVVAKL